MTLKTKVRESLIKMTGYWIYKQKDIPVGCDLKNDLKHKICLPIRTVFDVGANIGQTALRYNEYFNESMIYSFEPITKTFHDLANNTKNLGRVMCFNLALGDKVDSIVVDVFEGESSILNSLKKESMNKNGNLKETVEVTTGDIFCKENNISEIDLLKIDNEGYEIQVLHGFSKMIRESKVKAVYCEVGFDPENIRNTYINDLIAFASENDFTFYGLYEVINLEIKTGYNHGNILFINSDVINNLL